MSLMGQKRTSEQVRAMSALPPKADIGTHSRDVCFVPKADSCSAAINCNDEGTCDEGGRASDRRATFLSLAISERPCSVSRRPKSSNQGPRIHLSASG